MSEPFLSQINVFPYNFAPIGWALCNGQLLAINQNTALFSLLGTTYGGDGVQTFALPNLQGRFAVSFDNNYVMGQLGGEYAHTLVASELPRHAHTLAASSAAATSPSPIGDYPASLTGAYTASAPNPSVNLSGGSSSTGGGQAHENRPPFAVFNFCISLVGIYPSRN
jgi:microcystin-dependent protein